MIRHHESTSCTHKRTGFAELFYNPLLRRRGNRTATIFKRIVIAVSLIGFISVILPSTETSAAPSLVIKQKDCTDGGGTWVVDSVPYCSGVSYAGVQTPDWQVKSLLYYRILSACFQNNDSVITSENGQSGKWFEPGEVVAGAYLRGAVSKGEGGEPKADCNNPSDAVKPALGMWGWGTNYNQALCDFGWQRANGTPCLSSSGGSGNFELASGKTGGLANAAFRKTVKNSIYSIFNDSIEPDLDGAGWYTFYLRTLKQSCVVGSTGVTVKPAGFSTDSAESKAFVISELIDDTMKKVYYTNTAQQRNKELATRIGPNLAPVTNTCAYIEGRIDNYASDYKKWAASHPEKVAENEASNTAVPGTIGTENSTCVIEGIGWIICPVVTFMANLVDGAYAFVSSLLVVQPLFTTGETAGVYDAWAVMRNIANGAFVVSFLIIIFSQLTSIGLGNYGIKKMLPRLVIAAILVNISYWICSIAVDISNILGGSIRDVFAGVGASLPTDINMQSIADTGSGWVGIAGGVIAGTVLVGSALYVGLAALLPALIAALVAIVTVFLVLTLRQALIILLIVISPLAFVAFLLPNTEDLFKKWRKLLTTLLLMYPIIAGIFGASALASGIVMSSASGEYKIAIQIMGALIAILPLAITPIVMKTAGGVLNRFGGAINNPNKGPFDRMRKGADNIQNNSRVNRGLRAMDPTKTSMPGRKSFINWRNRRNTINSGRAEQLKETQQESMAQFAVDNTRFAEKVGGKTGATAYQARSQAILNEQDDKKVKNAEFLLRAKFDPQQLKVESKNAFDLAVTNNDAIGARAAQRVMMTTGASGLEDMKSSLAAAEASGKFSTEAGQSMSRELRVDINAANLKGRDNTLAQWAYDPSGRSLVDVGNDSATYSGLTDVELASQTKSSLTSAVRLGTVSTERAERMLASDSLKNALDEGKRDILNGEA